MADTKLSKLATRFIDAWNSQDVDQVLACYTDDVSYWDPGTRGEGIQGQDALRRYLSRLFDAWKMHWSLREVYALQEGEGAAVLWRATLQKASGGAAVEVNGMDLVLLAGDRIRRNDVYFDRAVLAPLLGPSS